MVRRARSPSRKHPEVRRAQSARCLYLGCFFFDEPGDPEYTGTFQIVMEAKDPEDAFDRFRKRLKEMRRGGSLFTKPMTIYVEGIIKLTGSFERGLLVNWESHPRPKTNDYQVTSLIPEPDGHKAVSYGLSQDDGETIKAFVDFGGEAYARSLNAARKASGPAGPGSAIAGPPRLSPEERARAREESAARKKLRAAEAEAGKRRRTAAREAKAARQRAIGETLAVLGSAPRKPGK